MSKNILFINSKNKIKGTSTNFEIWFNNPIEIHNYIKLSYAIIPHTCYTFTTLESIKLTINNINYDVYIPPGAYGINNLVIGINKELLNLGLDTAKYYCLYNVNTFKFSFVWTDLPYQSILLSENIQKILGFNNNWYVGNTNMLTSNYSVKFNSNNILFLKLDQIQNINVISTNNILWSFIIPILGDPGSYIVYNERNQIENINCIKCNLNFTYLNISLYGENNTIFDNNNNDILLIFEYD